MPYVRSLYNAQTKPLTTNDTKTILICDDEKDLQVTYKEILRSDYSVITVSSGRECIETYSQKKKCGETIHVILLDYRLGDMTGDQVATDIMALNGTRIILVSAYEIESPIIDKLRNNKVIVESLAKPISYEELREAVRRALVS
jgi:CheY-like chemotaxis protein